MKFYYQKIYVDCECMMKQDYSSVRDLHRQGQEPKGNKQRTWLQSKWCRQRLKKKKGHSVVVGGRVTGIHVNKGACQTHTHTHTHTHTACLSLSRHQRPKHR